MKNAVRIVLQATPEQAQQLQGLQNAFADVCNALAPRVQQTRCWNRVTLHHLAYRELRQEFPQLGSQMVCNAIYAVSQAARALFQAPGSPFNVQTMGDKPLPRMRFASTSPVYFDRHTLSLRGSELSLYTLSGRMRFKVPAGALEEAGFHDRKLREALLTRTSDGPYELMFTFGEHDEARPRSSRRSPDTRPPISQHVQLERSA